MREFINKVFAELDIGLRPLDPETLESANTMSGLNIVLRADPGAMTLEGRCDLLALDDICDPRFPEFQKHILRLNDLDFLPGDFRIGVSLVDLTVQMKGVLSVNPGDSGTGGRIMHMLKSMVFYGTVSRDRLLSSYDELYQESSGTVPEN